MSSPSKTNEPNAQPQSSSEKPEMMMNSELARIAQARPSGGNMEDKVAEVCPDGGIVGEDGIKELAYSWVW